VDKELKKMDETDFIRLTLENKLGMYRLAFSILRNEADAEDAVSETVLKAYEKLDKLRNTNKFKPWIMKILVNQAKTMLRGKNRIDLMADMEQLEMSFDNQTGELWSVVSELEEEFRNVVILFYYEDMTTREIAKTLQIAEGTVKSRLSRAREKLKQKIG